MSKIAIARPTRRDFLGVIGLALIDLAPGTNDDSSICGPSTGPEFHGCLGDLVLKFPLGAGWTASIDALIESLDAPHAWVLEECSKVSMLCAGLPSAEMATRYRAAGVEKVCESTYSFGTGDQRHDYVVEMAVLQGVRRCQVTWQQFDQLPEEAGLVPSTGVGDAMRLSLGGYCLPGKVFFRRGNVLVSVVSFFAPQDSAREFAVRLDHWILSCSTEIQRHSRPPG